MAERPSKINLNFALDLRIVVIVLLVAIAAMLLLWRPWSDGGITDRTISVSGEATVSAEPDEYVFSPTYQFNNADQDAALAALTKKSDEIVAELKKLGVADKNIKTNANNYDFYYRMPESEKTNYTLGLTVTVDDKELAQKVQDYLLTTSPSGSVTPNATFSDAKRKELENQARDEATKDARAKADQSAKNLGFKVGAVKEVSDGSGFGVFPTRGIAEDMAVSSEGSKLSLQPGENDLTYSVTVVYYVK